MSFGVRVSRLTNINCFSISIQLGSICDCECGRGFSYKALVLGNWETLGHQVKVPFSTHGEPVQKLKALDDTDSNRVFLIH